MTISPNNLVATNGMPESGVPVLNKDGLMNRPWWIFFNNLYNQAGGTQGASSDDLALSLPEDAGIEESKFQIIRNKDEAAAMPSPYIPTLPDDYSNARLEALEAVVAQIQSDIQAIRQGTLP